MAYRWRPNASQRRAFAERMQDPEEKAAYEERKRKRNSYEGFKDREFVATREQHDFCLSNMHLATEYDEQHPRTGGNQITAEDAFNQVMSSFSCNEKIHHDYIHIVNEIRRGNVS